MVLFIGYLVAVFLYAMFLRRRGSFSFFSASQKVRWWISGLSLYMLFLSVDQGQLLTGIIAQHGMQGMWLVWSAGLGAFVVPIIFAPLWHRLNFPNDNRFLVFRYPGKDGIFLQRFRAAYVGILVVSLLTCFHLLGFSRILEYYFHLSPDLSLVLGGCIMTAFTLKNVFDVKLKLDTLHAIMFFISLGCIAYFVFGHYFQHPEFNFFLENPEKKELLPTSINDLFSFAVFLGVQWWSCNMFDGGGAETARFTAVSNPKEAVKAGILPVIIGFILSFFLVFHVVVLLGVGQHAPPHEMNYLRSLDSLLSPLARDIVLLGYFAMFISTVESLITWGASLVVSDLWKGWIWPDITEAQTTRVSLLCIAGIGIISSIFAYCSNDLQQVIKITFSIGAGVAPLYIIRWFWYRINGWSQIAAMLVSGITTLLYPSFHSMTPMAPFPMEESRIVVVTGITTMMWLLVTFLTKDESPLVRSRMLPFVGAAKDHFPKFALALMLGFLMVGMNYLIWRGILH
jgi:Na+/proline symporter